MYSEGRWRSEVGRRTCESQWLKMLQRLLHAQARLLHGSSGPPRSVAIGIGHRHGTSMGTQLQLVAAFHSSRSLWDRKGGSQAFEVGHRDFSKKQKRRKARILELRALKRDPKKEKLKMTYMKKQCNSPEMQAFIESTKQSLSESLHALLLPDGATGPGDDQPRVFKSRLIDRRIDPLDVLLQLQRWTSHLGAISDQELLQQSSAQLPTEAPLPSPSAPLSSSMQSISTPPATPSAIDPSVEPVTPLEANRALAMLVERGETDDAEEMLLLMHHANIAPQPITFTHAMSMLSKEGQHDRAEAVFNAMVSLGIEPDTYAWTALVHAKTSSGQLAEAQLAIYRISKVGIASMPMYNSLLKALVDRCKRTEAYALWERMHLEPNLDLSLESFTIILKLCAQTREVERAFFYMDEMRGLGIKPDVVAFVALFRACAGAPHWVNGYQDTIFEAMAMMEGAELAPTTEIYNAIIYAFGKAGDCAAAEFYFWEMRAKGIAQTRVTYNALFDAYAKSQSVGARHYATRGRYVRPPERPKTKEEKLFLEVGNKKITEIMSQGLWQDIELERGKRQVGPLEDLMDDNPEAQEDLLRLVEHEVSVQRATNAEESIGGRRRLLLRGAPPVTEEDAEYDENDENNEVDEASLPRSKEEEEAVMRDALEGLLDEDKVTMKDLMKMLEGRGDGEGKGKERGDSREKDEEEAALRRQGQQLARGRRAPPASTQGKDKGMMDILSMLDAAQAKEETKLRSLSSDEAIEAALEGDGGAVADDDDDKDELEQGYEGFEGYDGDEYEDQDGPTEADRIASAAASPPNVFSDPFVHLRPSQSISSQPAAMPLPTPALNALQLLDGNVDPAAARHPSRASQTPGNESLGLLMLDELSDEDSAWAMVDFGRAPEPDYSAPLPVRQHHHMRRAELAFEDFRRQGLDPDTTTLTSFMSVYAEALKDQRALKVMETFAGHHLQPDRHSYRALVRMYIRRKDVTTAKEVCDEMHASGLRGDGETYGMLIESYAHRDMLPEALKMLETAADNKVGVPERHLRILRARCTKLEVRHPDMPADPQAWVKAAKAGKTKINKGTTRRTQHLRSWN